MSYRHDKCTQWYPDTQIQHLQCGCSVCTPNAIPKAHQQPMHRKRDTPNAHFQCACSRCVTDTVAILPRGTQQLLPNPYTPDPEHHLESHDQRSLAPLDLTLKDPHSYISHLWTEDTDAQSTSFWDRNEENVMDDTTVIQGSCSDPQLNIKKIKVLGSTDLQTQPELLLDEIENNSMVLDPTGDIQET